jgi:hypothetical protein
MDNMLILKATAIVIAEFTLGIPGIRFANEGNKRNKVASGAVQTTIPVGDT